MKILAVSGTLLALYYIIHFSYMASQYSLATALLERTNQGISRLPWGASNVVSGIINPFVFLTLYLAFKENNSKKKKIWFSCCGLIILATFLTLSRGGIISLFVGALILLILFKKYHLLSCLSLAILLILNFVLLLKDHLPFLQELFIHRIDSYTNGRSDIWTNSLAWIHNHYSSMIGYYMSLNTFGHTSHNILLTTFIERGLIGLILIVSFAAIYLSWIIKNIYSPIKAVSVFYKFVLAATLVSWIHFQTEDFNFAQPYFFYSWCLLGLIFSAKSILSTTEIQKFSPEITGSKNNLITISMEK